MSLLAAIARQLDEVRAEREDACVVRIRVTRDAVCGSVVAVPVTPERARVLARLVLVRDDRGSAAVVADPAYYEHLREVLIHPADWMDLLASGELVRTGAVVHTLSPVNGFRVWGIRVDDASP